MSPSSRAISNLRYLWLVLPVAVLLITFAGVPRAGTTASSYAGASPTVATSPEADSTTAIQQTKLVAPEGQGEDVFGVSVAVSGDTVVVGATGEAYAGLPGAGAAHVFERTDGVWRLQGSLVAADAEPFDHLGASVAISGDTAIIGAPGDDHAADLEAGSAYLFTRSAGVWTQQAKLSSAGARSSAYFGSAVAIAGDTAAVGSAENRDGLSGAGAVYLFTRTGGVWSQQARLVAPTPQALAYFGRALAITGTGNTVVVAAPGVRSNTGAAYVFTRSNGIWSPQGSLAAAGGMVGDLFGSGVAISGNTVIVGAHGADAGGRLDSGAAYVFTRGRGVWSQAAKLVAADPLVFDSFGTSVGLSGDIALVGANYEDPDGFYQGGSVYAFRRRGGVWSQVAKLVAADVQDFNYFGQSLSVSDQTAVIGAHGNGPTAGPVNVGAAYVFTPGP